MNTKNKSKTILQSVAGESLSVGELLWSIRKGDELTMTSFAELLKISKSHLNDIEKGRKPVSPKKAASYANLLGYSESQFVRLALQEQLIRSDLNYEVEIFKKKGA
jgi:transcriptional regulator with XRE-family HTH domain